MKRAVDLIRNTMGIAGVVTAYLGMSTVDYAAEVGRATDWRPLAAGMVMIGICALIVLVEVSEDYDD